MTTTATAPPIVKRRPGKKIPGLSVQAHHCPPGIDSDAAKHVTMALARRDAAVWFECFGRIVMKSGELSPPKMNTLQRRVLEAYLYCLANDIPCRIIVLKPRQKGSSTWATGLLYWICMSSQETIKARIIGGKYKQVKNLWDMLETYAVNDECLWPKGKARVLDDRAEMGDCEVTKETALDDDAGRGGSFRIVLATELGRWKSKGVAAAAKVLNGILACVPRLPGTLVIMESTAQGVGGEFHSRYWKASTMEQFRAGRRGSGYIRVFAAWFEFPDSRVTLTEKEKKALAADLSEEEREIVDRYDLDMEQMAWRRFTIDDECDGDTDKFKQEYPSNEEEAFLTSGRPKFSRSGIAKQQVLARAAQQDMVPGEISINDDYKTSWQSTDTNEAVFHRYEEPMEGRSYLVILDPATGESQAAGLNPDVHSIIVLRAGYVATETGLWVQPAVACRIRPPRKDYKEGCRWDPDVVTDAIYRLAIYYGNCKVVVEMNKDLGVIELLKAKGRVTGAPRPNLYQRKVFNEREQRTMKAYGWNTTSGNRDAVIGVLAKAIRETGGENGGISINCLHAVSECAHFEVGPTGRAEAADGWHDDDVMSLAIGMQCIGEATPYYLPRVTRAVPAEVQRMEARQEKRRPRGQYS